MRMIRLDADTVPGGVLVWFDGQEVSQKAILAYVPAQEDEEAPGWVDFYTVWRITEPARIDRRYGFVRWRARK